MHDASMALFLVAVAVIGTAPLVMLGVYAARRRHDRRLVDDRSSGTPARALAIGIATVVVATVGVAWLLGARGSIETTSNHAAGVDEGGSNAGGMDMGATGGKPSLLPPSLSGMPMAESVTGAEAVRGVEQLHGTSFPMESAEIARYAGVDGMAMVWVAVAGDPADATDLMRRMVDRISEGSSPFEPPRRIAGKPGVWSTRGMGQAHYFFARGDSVWWVSADPGMGDRVLPRLLKVAG